MYIIALHLDCKIPLLARENLSRLIHLSRCIYAKQHIQLNIDLCKVSQ